MFTKIHLAFYDILFELYGKLYKYYKAKGDKQKMLKCVEERENILNIMFTLKGIA